MKPDLASQADQVYKDAELFRYGLVARESVRARGVIAAALEAAWEGGSGNPHDAASALIWNQGFSQGRDERLEEVLVLIRQWELGPDDGTSDIYTDLIDKIRALRGAKEEK